VSGLPLSAKFHHAAVVVSDLDRSVDFYTRLFGGEVEVIRGIEGEEMAALHGLPSARFDLAFLRYGEARIELFQFHEPAPAEGPGPLAANQIGAAHVAFQIDDVMAAYERLLAAGVEFSRPPLAPTEGEAAGFVLAFLYDPDGNRIELIAPPRDTAAGRPAKAIALTVAAERREQFLELALPVVAATGEEAGAEDFSLHQVEGDESRFWIYERYRDDEALAAHHDQPQLKALLAALEPLLAEPPQIVELRTVALT
jgi:catechol 2,3-dioxygenase-like lactoylglutathione lyase family enzyme/quinol monooxygenase YgiN